MSCPAAPRISKPYLSLIETGRVPNPPSDEKLRRLEQTLDFKPGELLTQAHLQRTPREVRAVLQSLLTGKEKELTRKGKELTRGHGEGKNGGVSHAPLPASSRPRVPASALPLSASALPAPSPSGGIDLDEAYLTGVLQVMVENAGCSVEPLNSGVVPVINRVSAGYPQDFTDLGFPPRSG